MKAPIGIGRYLTVLMRSHTDFSSSAAVTPQWPRARAQLEGAATQAEKMPENTLSESVHSSKSLWGRLICQYLASVDI
jgi:hypothetical protein